MDILSDFATDINQVSIELPTGRSDFPEAIPLSDEELKSPDEQPPLIVRIGSSRHEIMPSHLEHEDEIQYWRTGLLEAEEIPEISLENLLFWEHEARWPVLLFIGHLERSCRYLLSEGGAEYANIFEAVLAFFNMDMNAEPFERVRHAAVEAVAILYASEITFACNRIIRRLKEIHITGYTVSQLKREAETYAKAAHAEAWKGEPAENTSIYVRDILSDAPVPEDTIVPPRWQLSTIGVLQMHDEETETILPTPLVISRRLFDISSNSESLEIAWYRDTAWQSRIVARSTLFTSRGIVDLADFGLPVTSNNAATVVQFLADYEAANLDILPRSLVSQQLGWLKNHEFLWGKRLISAETPHLRTLGDFASENPVRSIIQTVTFRGADEGDNQLAEGFRAEGSREEWMTAIKPLANYPKVQLAIYAALSTPLLMILNAPNFIFSFAGATSQGKTTALRVAASCWGCPDERSPRAAIGTWDSTRIWIERAAAVENDLPLILDDTKRARRPEDTAQTIYDVTSGRSRGRGSLEGTRSAQTFRTVMLSSGEAPITSFSNAGGTRARVLEIWGSPFGNADAETAVIVNALNEGILENYGHAGPQLIEQILVQRESWPTLQELYRDLRRQYQELAGDNPAASRMASHFAVMEVTAKLLHTAGLLPWKYSDPIRRFWQEMAEGAAEADRATAAIRFVMSWAYSHRDDFFRTTSDIQPHGGWAGRWKDKNIGGPLSLKKLIAFFPHRLDEILKAGGFEPEPILRSWFDRNWLLVTEGRRQLRMRVGEENSWLVALDLEKIEMLDVADQEENLHLIASPTDGR
jgi:hypothetical protein